MFNRRFKHNISLEDRLSAWAKGVREQADKLRPGPERDMLLKKAEQASHLNDGVNSPGLQRPK
jgi:hypothetical protein